MKRQMPLVLVAAVMLTLGFVLSGVLRTPSPSPVAAEQNPALDEQNTEELAELAGQVERLFQHAAERVKPAVVAIHTERVVRAERPGPRDPFFEEFFREFFGQTPERERRRPGIGSGMILDERGHILTNYHVIRDVDALVVQLADGRTHDAEVVGTDDKTDLAVIRIKEEVSGLPHVEFADSDALNIGQWVLAVGNPFGLAHTVSAGIVSATGRTGMGVAEYESMIQTDAAINPGNSGGPLVNLRGEVVGINTAIFTRTGGYMGIGFAIPSNMALPILDDLIAGREIVRGYLGVYITQMTDEMADAFGMEEVRGVLVQEVQPDSPAEQAGLEAGDVILEYNGERVDQPGHLQHLATTTDPGTEVTLILWRDGERLTLQVEVGQLEEEVTTVDWLGIQVEPLTQEQARRLGRPDLRGMVITEVEPDTPAARAEIRPDDVILSVNRAPVSTTEEYRERIDAAAETGQVLLRVLDSRTGRARFVLLRRR